MIHRCASTSRFVGLEIDQSYRLQFFVLWYWIYGPIFQATNPNHLQCLLPKTGNLQISVHRPWRRHECQSQKQFIYQTKIKQFQTHQGLCHLQMQHFNEKIFMILWVWFSLLLIFSAVYYTQQLFLFSVRFLRVYSIWNGSFKWEVGKKVIAKLTVKVSNFLFHP